MLWEHVLSGEFEKLLPVWNYTCVLDIGCVEQHGHHMPLGCDTLWGGDMVEAAAEIADVCVFPRLYFGDLVTRRRGKPGEHGVKSGYIAFSHELLYSMLEGICEEIGRNGFKKILICSSHGGNTPFMRFFQRGIGSKIRDYEVFTLDIEFYEPRDILKDIKAGNRENYPLLTDEDITILQSYADNGGWDGHGGFVECSYMLATYPELVRLDKCEETINNGNGKGNPVIEAGIGWDKLWEKHHPDAHDGYYGTTVTPTIAKTLYDLETEKVAKIMKFVKEDERLQALIDEK